MTMTANSDAADAGASTSPSSDPTGVDAIVLGAGISGLVSASILLDQGARRIVVVDEYPAVGGNHIDRAVGPYTFDVGSLIFQDDSSLVTRFPELLPHYVEIDPTWARLNPQGVVTDYPFSLHDDIVAAGPVEWVRMAASLMVSRIRYRRQRNARDFAWFWVGRRMAARTGLEHYMERFCGVGAEHVELTFARSRMMWIAEHARVGKQLRALLRQRRGVPPQPRRNVQLVRPREGFGSLYAPVVAQLEARGVQFVLGEPLRSITMDPDAATVNTATRSVTANRVISTIPIDRTLALVGEDPRELPTVTLITLFYSFSGERGFTAPILYNFSHDGAWKRLTMHSDFYGTADDREFFAVEVISAPGMDDVPTAHASFVEHAHRNSLFTGDLTLESGHVLTNTYPVFVHGSEDRAREAIALLHSLGIVTLGKQGGFEYQPTARVSTIHAERILAADAEAVDREPVA